MPKKCIICGKEAKFYIKGTNDYYCEECAQENFSDLSLLVSIESQVSKIKNIIDEKVSDKNKEFVGLEKKQESKEEEN